MKLTIDTEAATLAYESANEQRILGLYTEEAFELISQQWVRVGWQQRYSYTFSWMGRPIVQLPEDMIRVQEIIYRIQPDVIIETGIAHGGSLIYYASLCKAMEKGRVVGIDIEIRPHNRKALEEHELASRISLIEGSSIAPEVVQQVHSLVKPGETVLVILDSNHSRQHVLDELEAYHDLVTNGSYIIATDGIMKDLFDLESGEDDWRWDNPSDAAATFAETHPDFAIEEPPFIFNEGLVTHRVTYWPRGLIKRIK